MSQTFTIILSDRIAEELRIEARARCMSPHSLARTLIEDGFPEETKVKIKPTGVYGKNRAAPRPSGKAPIEPRSPGELYQAGFSREQIAARLRMAYRDVCAQVEAAVQARMEGKP